jgi:hypothetical protein
MDGFHKTQILFTVCVFQFAVSDCLPVLQQNFKGLLMGIKQPSTVATVVPDAQQCGSKVLSVEKKMYV